MEDQFTGMLHVLTDKLGKTKAEIISEYSQSNRQILFQFSEMLFNGILIFSNGMLYIDMENYGYNFEIRGNLCQHVYLYIDDIEFLNKSIAYCNENYPLITDKTWLIASEKATDKCSVVYLFENKDAQLYFQSALCNTSDSNLLEENILNR